MLYDFDLADTPSPRTADICIVGAGAAGIALATELAAHGRTVTLLEGGGTQQENRSQTLYRSAIAGQPHRGIHEGRFRTYGGTTTRWGGQMLELQPLDFERRDWVPGSGWPFPKTELTAHYERALHFAGLRRVPRIDADVWRDLGIDRNLAATTLDPLTPLTSRWLPERNVAELHARTLRESRRIHVHTHASVTGFRLNAASTALEALHIRGFSGRTAEVSAKHFVLCLGAIETNRLLLQPAADGAQLPWQANGLLGQHFQDHIGVNGIPVNALMVHRPWRTFGYSTLRGFRFHNKLWLRPEIQRKYQTLNVAGTLGPLTQQNFRGDEALRWLRSTVRQRRRPSLIEALRHAPQIPGLLAERLSMRYRGEAPAWRRVMLTVHAEQSPLTPSHIALSHDRDELGLFRSRLDWKITAAELHTIRTYVRIATETFALSGLGDIDPPKDFFTDDALLRSLCGDSYHHMGGTRMSTNPADGIVDPSLRVHGLANAHICAASVFPTSGFSNPTHTVLALAMRLADKLAAATAASSTAGRQEPANEEARTGEGAAVLPFLGRSQTGGIHLAAPGNVSLPTVTLPHSNAVTTQLGFGCAYLLGSGLDAAKSRRLLDAAWDAGIRHFDAARLYGMGHTEALLGEFLRDHPEATVTSKFGVLPPTSFQRNLMRAQRFIPSLGKLLPPRNDKAVFRASHARASLETSLRALRRDRIELFLLHEARAEDLAHPDLLEFLEKKRADGTIGDFGFGGEYANIPDLLALRKPYLPVLQFERSLLSPPLDTGTAWCAYYRTFAPAAQRLTHDLGQHPERLRRWSEQTGIDLAEPGELSRLLLRATLDAWPASLQLFSTSSEANLFSNAEAATDPSLGLPAARLTALISGIR